MKAQRTNSIMSMRDIQVLLSEQMKTLESGKDAPSTTTISAANAQANLVGKYMSTIKLTMEYAKMVGQKPDLQFLQLANGKAEPMMNSKTSSSDPTKSKRRPVRVS